MADTIKEVTFRCQFRRKPAVGDDTAWLVGYNQGETTNVMSCAMIGSNVNDLVNDWRDVARIIPYNLTAVGIFMFVKWENFDTDDDFLSAGKKKIQDSVFSNTKGFSLILTESFVVVIYSDIDHNLAFNVNIRSKEISVSANKPTFLLAATDALSKIDTPASNNAMNPVVNNNYYIHCSLNN